MKKLLKVIGLYILGYSLAFADISIQLVDHEGRPVPNAVVSVPQLNNVPVISPAELDPAVMDQVNKQFLPHVLVVKAGQQVAFPNSDQVRHHVYSFSKPNDFEIRLYSGYPSETLSFEHPGIVVLGCNIHDQMLGYVYVEQNEEALVTNGEGIVSFDDRYEQSLSVGQSVNVWHSQLSNNKIERFKHVLAEKNAQGNWVVTLALIPEVKKTSRKFKLRY